MKNNTLKQMMMMSILLSLSIGILGGRAVVVQQVNAELAQTKPPEVNLSLQVQPGLSNRRALTARPTTCS